MNEWLLFKETYAGICKYCGEKMVKHIIKEGARYHVHWWNGYGEHCTTKDCEDNHGDGKCNRAGE